MLRSVTDLKKNTIDARDGGIGASLVGRAVLFSPSSVANARSPGKVPTHLLIQLGKQLCVP